MKERLTSRAGIGFSSGSVATRRVEGSWGRSPQCRPLSPPASEAAHVWAVKMGVDIDSPSPAIPLFHRLGGEGRYVLTTSRYPSRHRRLGSCATTGRCSASRGVSVVLKDFLGLRPIYHWTEQRVRGHIALCVLAAVVEAVTGNGSGPGGRDGPRSHPPGDQPSQRHVTVVTRRNALQGQVLKALGVGTSSWDRATIA